MGARHVRLGPGFIDEGQTVRLQIDLPLEPGAALPKDVLAVLLAGVRGLFFRVSAWRRKKRWIVP